MAWSASKIYTCTIEDVLENTTAFDANSDTFKASLYSDAITPDQTVASAAAAYGSGVWASGEQSHAVSWPAGGQALSVTSSFSSNVYTFDSTDTASADGTATLSGVMGCLVYDDTLTTPVGDQAICYNYFGGTASVTSGRLH